LLAVAILFAGCRSTQPAGNGLSAPEAERLRSQVDSLRQAADSLQQSARLRHPGLNGTLWQQTAVEYAGTTRGAYQLAAVMAERALDDSTWTAAIEQSEMGAEAYRSLPPAVVLDVDETVLDNSAYQARLVRTNTDYAPSSWKAWCREEAAGAVPGALAFTRTMAEQGVQVIYLTNRDGDVESATRDNLRQLGFPIRETKIDDAVLTQGEREGWEPKTARRAWVAEQFRILLLIGDNFGDFADEVETSLAERKRKADAFEKYWGTRWIVLPNTQYGSWEGALFNYDYSLPALDVLKQKHQRLETKD
jgi:acid phosphatase